jgi:hypothetical protein
LLVPQVSCSIGAVMLLCRVGRILLVVISRLHVSAAITISRASEIEREYASNDCQGGADTSKVRDATDGA